MAFLTKYCSLLALTCFFSRASPPEICLPSWKGNKQSFADLVISDRSTSLFRIEKNCFATENHTDITEIFCFEEKNASSPSPCVTLQKYSCFLATWKKKKQVVDVAGSLLWWVQMTVCFWTEGIQVLFSVSGNFFFYMGIFTAAQNPSGNHRIWDEAH